MNALQLWRAELKRGRRTPTTLDALWRAACCEASAAEFDAAGLPSLAEERQLAAAEHIVRDAKESAKRRVAVKASGEHLLRDAKPLAWPAGAGMPA